MGSSIIEEKVFGLKLVSPQHIRRRLESMSFTYATPIQPSAGLQGYWQAPQGPMVTIWLMPLTQPDMEIDRTLKGNERFVRFFLHVRPFKGGPQYPPVDPQTAGSIWKAIDTAMSPLGRFVAGTTAIRGNWPFSRVPRRYGQTPCSR